MILMIAVGGLVISFLNGDFDIGSYFEGLEVNTRGPSGLYQYRTRVPGPGRGIHLFHGPGSPKMRKNISGTSPPMILKTMKSKK